MQGKLRTNSRPAKIRLRIQVNPLPAGATVEITDLMLQPGGTHSGWLPHVTELPWSAGVGENNMYPSINFEQVNARLDALEEGGTLAPASPWQGPLGTPETEQHPRYGPIYWYSLNGATGTITFTTSPLVPALGLSRGQRLRLIALTDDVQGVTAIQGRPDLLDGTTRVSSPIEPEFALADGDSGIHTFDLDFVQPGNLGARAAVVLVGASEASGRVGLAWPAVGTAVERSA
ncbi:hypothetical protein [Nesterenkonia sp.]|uniref:hypothetical protein n=1 Tax=Nesterenkonia sp. TaxID=704201 RepID=UPI00263076FC|nr:hypothetical protein [Nesterenkonia sp.]